MRTVCHWTGPKGCEELRICHLRGLKGAHTLRSENDLLKEGELVHAEDAEKRFYLYVGSAEAPSGGKGIIRI